MKLVTLVSGGLDSTVMAVLAKEEGVAQLPLFIDYGQLGRERELGACRRNLRRHMLPKAEVASLRGLGVLLPCGLTSRKKDVYEDAFLPLRNLLFLTVAAAYASQRGASAVAIGLLDDAFSRFPDQTKTFVQEAEGLLTRAGGRSIRLVTPLMSFSKADIVRIAKARGIRSTYSCHKGTKVPCGVCVACREYIGLEV